MKNYILVLFALTLFNYDSRAENVTISKQEKQLLVKQTAQMLEQRYVHAKTGLELAKALRTSWEVGELEHLHYKQQTADFFTAYLREKSKDGHLAMDYHTPSASEKIDSEVEFQESEIEKWYGAHINHGFFSIQRLENNIGLIDLRVFAPLDMAEDLAKASMVLSAQYDALIIDLRKNGGGFGELGHVMMSYLFDKPNQRLSGIINRPNGTSTQYFTSSLLPKRRFGGKKPLYILTSTHTFSAAEAFAYDLKALGRAKIIGEVTGGGAHPFEYRALENGFFLSLAEAKSFNPITKSNWQNVGVQPDIKVSADRALEKAIELANKALGSKEQ